MPSVEPLHAVPLVPLAPPRPPLGVEVRPDAVVLSVEPLASVGPPVGPAELALPRFPVLQVAALVDAAVRPPHVADAVHLTIEPLALVDPAVGEGVCALTVHGVVHEVAAKGGPVGRVEVAEAVLLSVEVLALELRPVDPCLVALARLHVLLPLAVVRGPVGVEELAAAVRLVVHPLPLVHVAVGVREPPGAVVPVVPELPVVPAAVGPDDHAVAVRAMACVRRAALQGHRGPLLVPVAVGAPLRLHVRRHLEPHGLARRGDGLLVRGPLGHAAWPALEVRQHDACRPHMRCCGVFATPAVLRAQPGRA
eukprot:CAMPEP_0179273252 /NCGR_PEP_ID=MMETSP0797-20121207/32919_1 /TAXON_ID=47934 /ORGANISM="Dinophysis acuminata, Strain DAEP01" /LENGTH=308 /DNA_ID=CAMNT_0020981677 /DNA_START=98 /DNA_END=1022 /DNA_ORIENTATION=-